MNTRVTWDRSADAAYISLKEISPGESSRQCVVDCADIAATIVLDVDRKGRLIGIEVIGAVQGLPDEVLRAAEL
jgi:uncharacterized protein YuzE